MQLKKLPIGIQTFSKIREDDFVYVDKTGIAYDLIEKYQYVFLSRPRRFGKSLFVDTLRNIFEGNKEYFKDLEIENKWNWDKKHPVILISFAAGRLENRDDLTKRWEEILEDNEERLGVKCHNTIYDRRCFDTLIRESYKKYGEKVVILIDEYDKPILDNITNPEIAEDMRNGLVDFYSIIKYDDEFIRFAFLTGVSKFAKTSIFSGLNNIVDISLHQEFGDICGYTQNDIDTTFEPYLKDVDKDELKAWYDGYNFLASSMYNPFAILNFIAKGNSFNNYWFESGTPTFLMKLIEKNRYFLPNLSDLKVDEKLLSSFDINNLDLEVILYQTGYLTIDKTTPKARGGLNYHLKIPNKEVKISFSDYVINYLVSKPNIDEQDNLYIALEEKNMDNFIKALKSIFAKIPYNNFTNNPIQNYEGFYSSVIFIYLQSLGLNIIGEDVTNKGRIDLTIIMPHAIFILEFKVDSKDESALKQIKDKNYAQKYLNENKDIYLIGIEFDSSEKNISNFEWEKI